MLSGKSRATRYAKTADCDPTGPNASKVKVKVLVVNGSMVTDAGSTLNGQAAVKWLPGRCTLQSWISLINLSVKRLMEPTASRAKI